ncbi:MAG: hypothetical protein A2X67_08000 [Ignavibacteria bacterium GWA2_55_11]|nr:MAG: hypothetical protein A2X67_08000 [Ignavibacteria bacterium GWA2_55_11]OGU68631.1 MAG: hypothetical protein A3C56_07720 [Ignavibacteria bacterium RIFCSPHIGHO2_02_FULL_56_12]OGU71181.1 MAG: hypothetical protein A3G43_05520 [Ignavibacteria bacterium RIFCSPLOWO2_12_FULL_56_21]OGU74774.1 MAG: hypothetical protein A3H45_10775 [Ignavibacteria bacterium RIFCSPLOWO2_02_FULL_55_14]
MKTVMRWISFILFVISAVAPGQRKTENVFLITVDGLRWNEVFAGADRRLMSKDWGGVKDSVVLSAKFWRDSEKDRRLALMPFLWTTLVHEGVVYGNRTIGSKASVANAIHISYPGYAEILTGRAQPEIASNEKKQIPATTILEFLKNELHLGDKQVAAFTSWDLYPYAVSRVPGAIYCNAGYASVVDGELTARQSFLNVLQDEVPQAWRTVRFDAFTFYHGMEFIKKHKPKVFYFAFGETDDWSHDRRYDHVLEAAFRVDKYLKELWEFAASDPQYAGKTTFILSSDHGRGSSATKDWADHGAEIAGSDEIWMAVFGPDTPKEGEAANMPQAYAMNIAATMAKLLGQDFRKSEPECGAPLPKALY